MNEDQTAAENRIAKMPQYVEHLVLLKTKRSPTAEEAERIASLTTVPGVCFIAAGDNYTARGQGFNYGISVRFISPEAEVKYQTHPLHVAVRDEVIKPLLDTSQSNPILAMDFEHTQPLYPKLVPVCVGFVAGALVTGAILLRRARK